MRRVGWVSTDINYSGDVRYYVWTLVQGSRQLVGNFASSAEAEQFLTRTR